MGKNKWRNKKCHCGSGKKFKKCCLFKNEGFIFNEQYGFWQKPGDEVKVLTTDEIEKITGQILSQTKQPTIKANMNDKAEISAQEEISKPETTIS